MVADGPEEGPTDGPRAGLVGVGGEVPLGGRGSDDELEERKEEGDDPEEAKEVVVPHVASGVVPLHAGEGSVAVLADLPDAVYVHDCHDPVHEEGPGQHDDERRQEQHRYRLEDELRRRLDDREGQLNVVVEAADGQEQDEVQGPEGNAQTFVVGLVARVRRLGRLVPEEVSNDAQQAQEPDERDPHQSLRTAAQEDHVEDRQDEGDPDRDQQHLPGRVQVRQILADLFGPRRLKELLARRLVPGQTVPVKVCSKSPRTYKAPKCTGKCSSPCPSPRCCRADSWTHTSSS